LYHLQSQMKSAMQIALWMALLLAPVQATTPVGGVIKLLDDLKVKIEEEQHAQATACSAKDQQMKDLNAEETQNIGTFQTQIQENVATIGMLATGIAEHGARITSHTATITTSEHDQQAAREVRQSENKHHQALEAELEEAIELVGRASMDLTKNCADQGQDQPQSLAQLTRLTQSTVLTTGTKQKLQSLMKKQPAAYAYEHKCEGILDTLREIKALFTKEVNDARKAEAERDNEFNLLIQDQTFLVENSRQKRTSHQSGMSEKQSTKADVESNLVATKADLKTSQTVLADVNSVIAADSETCERNKALQDQELEAIAKAVSILRGNPADFAKDRVAVTDVVSDSASSFSSYSQLHSFVKSPSQSRAVQYIQEQAAQLNSRILANLATHVQADDPFKKVKQMIEDLLNKLMEQAGNEAEHKGWCDTELATNEQTRHEKSTMVHNLLATEDSLSSKIAELESDIAQLTKDVTKAEANLAEQRQTHTQEQSLREQVIKEGKIAQEMLSQARATLEAFFHENEPSAFLQQPDRLNGKIVRIQKYDSQLLSRKGGIIGFLDVIGSGFARQIAETQSALSVSQTQFDKFETDTKVEIAAKNADIKHKQNARQDSKQDLADTEADRLSTQDELTAALHYYDKLKPSCVDAGVSHEDRVARRQEEIESLKKALAILNGD